MLGAEDSKYLCWRGRWSTVKGHCPFCLEVSNMNKSKFNQSEVSRITGKSRTTIQKDLNQGKLSYMLDEKGSKVIEASELIRVYGENICDFEAAGGPAVEKKKGEEGASSTEIISITTHERLLQKQEEQYKDQIEILTEALKTAQEGQNSMTRLLEDKREGQGDQAWEQSFRALEARISNQEAQAKEYKEKEAEQNRKYQRLRKAYQNQKEELRAEKQKPFWRKLFA